MSKVSQSAFVPKSVELRYVMEDVSKLLNALREHMKSDKGKLMRYTTTTYYLDKKPGTWSKGEGSKKFRLRNYGDSPNLWWAETKEREGDDVQKQRKLVHLDDFKEFSQELKGLRPIFAVVYNRLAFEFDSGLRVTIDRNLKLYNPKLQQLAQYPYFIVEVKRTSKVPGWLTKLLSGLATHKFSKSSWGLALTKGKFPQISTG